MGYKPRVHLGLEVQPIPVPKLPFGTSQRRTDPKFSSPIGYCDFNPMGGQEISDFVWERSAARDLNRVPSGWIVGVKEAI